MFVTKLPQSRKGENDSLLARTNAFGSSHSLRLGMGHTPCLLLHELWGRKAL